jgi:sphingolipid delta-4 desaturase
VTYKFITDPSVGMWSRAKRATHGERLSESLWAPTPLESGSEMSEGESSEDEKMGERMREATERGYGSEPE